MDTITDIKVIAKFLTTLDKINQAYKNIYKCNSEYNISYGNIISDTNIDQIPAYAFGSIINEKSISIVFDYFSNNAITINSTEYFEFRKNKSDGVCEIEIEDREYIKLIRQSGNNITFEYNPKISLSYGKFLSKFNSFSKVIDKPIEMSYDEVAKFHSLGDSQISRMVINLTKEEVNIGNDITPVDEMTDKEDEFIYLSISKKFINGITKNTLKSGVNYSEINVDVYAHNSNEDLIAIKVNVINKFFTIEQVFILLDI